MIKSFEDYLNQAAAVKTIEELFSVYLKAVNNHGYDRALFALMTEHPDIGKDAGIGVIHNFPSDWMNHYFEKGYDQIDPVVTYGASQISAYTWEEIPKVVDLTKKQINCLNYGEEAGLKNGISTYLRGNRNQTAGISLATSEKTDAFDGRIDLITAYSNHFYMRYLQLLKIDKNKPQNIFLTPKEKEVLTWASLGKSNSVIADIINISENTVDFHFRQIFKKLDVNSRVLAVVKALTHGFIHP